VSRLYDPAPRVGVPRADRTADHGLGSALPPSGVTMVAIGKAEEGRLPNLDSVIRDEVEATVGWQEKLGALHRSGIPTASADVNEPTGASLGAVRWRRRPARAVTWNCAPLNSPRRVDHGYVQGIHSSPNGEVRKIWQ
jgi:hypothetical protein